MRHTAWSHPTMPEFQDDAESVARINSESTQQSADMSPVLPAHWYW